MSSEGADFRFGFQPGVEAQAEPTSTPAAETPAPEPEHEEPAEEVTHFAELQVAAAVLILEYCSQISLR